MTRVINENATQELYDLAEVAGVSHLDPECGLISFRLVDEAHMDIISVTPEGLVSILAMDSEDLVGTHDIQFSVYLGEIDPQATISTPIAFV